MGNKASAVAVTAAEIALESAEPDVVLENSDLEDAETSEPKQSIPAWVRWCVPAFPVTVPRKEEDLKQGFNAELASYNQICCRCSKRRSVDIR